MSRDKILNKDFKEYELTDYEFNYIKDLNTALQFNIFRERIVSGFLTYVASTRLGYTQIKEGYNLQYEVNPSGDDKKIKIRQVPIEPVAQTESPE